jgi:hypothetical protein
MKPARAFPPPHVRLPLRFDAETMLAEADALAADAWSPHFNVGYHNGGWSGVTLRSADGDARRLYVGPATSRADESDARSPRDTPVLARSAAIASALRAFACPIRAARLLRLAPGGRIDEHCDPDLVFDDGEARVHVVLRTDDGVEFRVDGEPVVMHAGEAWYLDLARPHRVVNRGAHDRIHLVVDVGVNAWLCEQIAAGDHPQRTACATGTAAFERFREHVWADPALAARLCAAGEADFVTRTIAEGRAAGCVFEAEDVQAAMAAGRRQWITQWLV